MVSNKTWVVGLMDRYYSRKTISNQSKKHELVAGLEFDPTDVGALKSTITWLFDVAKAVYRFLSGPINQMLI